MPDQVDEPAPPDIGASEKEWLVDNILNSGRWNKKVTDVVRWVGNDTPIWEPEEPVYKLQVLEDFHNQYPVNSNP